VIKANPDKAQRAVRARALTEGKVLLHGGAAPGRRAAVLPVDPVQLRISPWEAAAKEGAARAGRKVAAAELPSVDLIVSGSVAVYRQGARVGEGGGFSDLEVAFLVEAGVIRPDTVLATTVHPLQVVDESCPKPSTPSGWTHRHPRRGHLVHRAAPASRRPCGRAGGQVASTPMTPTFESHLTAPFFRFARSFGAIRSLHQRTAPCFRGHDPATPRIC
jgi:5-formyltetrahydrofolate cyclo-ligase